LVSAFGQAYHFMPLSVAENIAVMVWLGLIIDLAALAQLKVEES
jgi:hypothetical protein